jgi:hypothetical protein
MPYRGVLFTFLHELEECAERGMTLAEVIAELKELGTEFQILDWSDPIGHNYRFYIQQLEGFDGPPKKKVDHRLYLKEFTHNGN